MNPKKIAADLRAKAEAKVESLRAAGWTQADFAHALAKELNSPRTPRKPLYLGCTHYRHAQLGINAVINARAGNHHLNSETMEEIEQQRDARKIRARVESRVAFYQFNSRFFRRHASRFAHLISHHAD